MSIMNSRFRITKKPLLVPHHLPIKILPRKGWFSADRIMLMEDVSYYSVVMNRVIECKQGKYNGLSAPMFIRRLSFGFVSNIMPGLEASIPHDVVCRDKIGNRKQRRQLMAEALDTAMKQFNQEQEDAYHTIIEKMVIFGSKWFRYC